MSRTVDRSWARVRVCACARVRMCTCKPLQLANGGQQRRDFLVERVCSNRVHGLKDVEVRCRVRLMSLRLPDALGYGSWGVNYVKLRRVVESGRRRKTAEVCCRVCKERLKHEQEALVAIESS